MKLEIQPEFRSKLANYLAWKTSLHACRTLRNASISAQLEKDQKMEAEIQQIRREQDRKLREIERERQEMETTILRLLSEVDSQED